MNVYHSKPNNQNVILGTRNAMAHDVWTEAELIVGPGRVRSVGIDDGAERFTVVIFVVITGWRSWFRCTRFSTELRLLAMSTAYAPAHVRVRLNVLRAR